MLTAFDKALLNIIQVDLPLASRPFAVIAERLSVTEDEVINRLQELKAQGFIRRIGPFFDSAKLGYVGTLVAARVAAAHIADVAKAINAYSGVTHNYERYNEGETEYNLWFTLLTPSLEKQQQILTAIRQMPGVDALISLPADKKYKVSVRFTL